MYLKKWITSLATYFAAAGNLILSSYCVKIFEPMDKNRYLGRKFSRMKNLILIRHAKSSWDSPTSDIDRALETRGMKDAKLVAQQSLNFIPKTYKIFSSNARRASETARIFAQQYDYPLHEISFKPELYTFDESRLEQIVRGFDNCYDSIILFGHNEAITNFVNKFGHVFTDNVPTSGFVFLQLDTDDWQHIQSGKTLKTIFPRDLK